MNLQFKGQLCDGHVHLTARQFSVHKMRENLEKQRMKLRKLGNNPALSDDVKETIRMQIFYLNLVEVYRGILEEREKNDA